MSQGPQADYFDFLAKGEFRIQRCGDCGKAVFYPRVLCPHCGGSRLDWIAPEGRGTVYSTTVVRRKAEAGGDLNVALIDLAEGVRMMSSVVGLAPEEISIGMAVRFSHVAPEGDRVYFRAEASA